MTLPRLCFIHIPKTAGTAITHLLENIYPKKQTLKRTFVHEFQSIEKSSFDSYQLYLGHLPYQFAREHFPDNTQYLTVLREPVSRVLSQYFFLRSIPAAILAKDNLEPAQRESVEEARTKPLVDYLVSDNPRVHMATRNQQLRMLCDAKNKKLLGSNPNLVVSETLKTLDSFFVCGLQELLPFFIFEASAKLNVPCRQITKVNVNWTKTQELDKLPREEWGEALTLITKFNRPEIQLYEEVKARVELRINRFFLKQCEPEQ